MDDLCDFAQKQAALRHPSGPMQDEYVQGFMACARELLSRFADAEDWDFIGKQVNK
jgi:hypothetical protein